MRRYFRSRLWLGILLAGASAASAGPTFGATCGPSPATIADADVAFVGTLTAADPTGEHGTFSVEEVWKGGDLSTVVEVTGAPGQWSGPAVTHYLILAEIVEGTLRVGNGCNNAYIWDASMAAQRPAAAHPPSADAAGGGPPLQLLVAAGVMLAIGLISLYAFRRPRKAMS